MIFRSISVFIKIKNFWGREEKNIFSLAIGDSMVISVFKYPHDDFLVGIHLDFYVVTVEMVNGNDCVCQCPVQVLVFVLCPVISDCAVRWIVLIVQSVDEQNCTFLGQ